MAKMDFMKAFRFGAVGAVLLAVLTWAIGLFVKPVAKIQFALIESDLVAQVGIPETGLGGRLVGAILGLFGVQPNPLFNFVTVVVGGGIAVILGLIVYNLVKGFYNPRTQTGRLAYVLFLAGLVGGFIVGGVTGLPMFGTALTLALSAYVTAFILVWLLNLKAVKDIKLVKDSKLTL